MKLSGLSVIALIVAAASVVSLSAQDEKAAVAALHDVSTAVSNTVAPDARAAVLGRINAVTERI